MAYLWGTKNIFKPSNNWSILPNAINKDVLESGRLGKASGIDLTIQWGVEKIQFWPMTMIHHLKTMGKNVDEIQKNIDEMKRKVDSLISYALC